ncbi:MAG: hypothetical protein RQ824_11780 [bacterium]|nr:hypothetical protein [bacterium]
MTPDELRIIIEKAVAEGMAFPWWSYLIATVIGGLIVFTAPYLTRRGEHRADLEALPLTAAAVLKAENYQNSKREAYYEAINILTRFTASVPWSGPDIPTDRDMEEDRPLESEVNACIAKISIFTDNPDIPLAYINAFQSMHPIALGKLIELMRKDLGYGDLPFSAEDYLYHMKRTPSTNG